ncbi:DUF3626 domain-containing protein [Caulobacter sp. RHG1]|uniref:DUF3626 domain-containing protein n=1 Tax=Caulobacter sp. (strain RHG1) TaxID=2545762 RepID=UPI001552656C|nr:DUF3626 domain-containing protein [Caulobacter sp. RHG1]NQE63224.1 hypothetical protein [Caulobacter sp. RHG1]
MVEPCWTLAVRHVADRSLGAPAPQGCSVTLNFHPDAPHGAGLMIDALARDGVYRSQFETASSNGGLTAHAGGDRWRWESRIFGGVYDQQPPAMRPKYGALNYRGWDVGGSPRFGSAHIRLRPAALARVTFCYPDSHLEPEDFGVGDRMALIALAERNAAGLDILDDYIEAHVHGAIRIEEDVEAIVLDPSHAGTRVEAATARLPCRVEWHEGFRLPRSELPRCAAYRGEHAAGLLAALPGDQPLTPRDLGAVRGAGLDFQTLKQAWHCLARFGGPLPGV